MLAIFGSSFLLAWQDGLKKLKILPDRFKGFQFS